MARAPPVVPPDCFAQSERRWRPAAPAQGSRPGRCAAAQARRLARRLRAGKLSALEGKGRVFLLAATLRPETMYGQTNCWALPEGQYGAYRGLGDEIYVLTERSALNLSYQARRDAVSLTRLSAPTPHGSLRCLRSFAVRQGCWPLEALGGSGRGRLVTAHAWATRCVRGEASARARRRRPRGSSVHLLARCLRRRSCRCAASLSCCWSCRARTSSACPSARPTPRTRLCEWLWSRGTRLTDCRRGRDWLRAPAVARCCGGPDSRLSRLRCTRRCEA